MVLNVYIVLFGTIPAGLAADEAAVSNFQSQHYRFKLDPSLSDLDLPFAIKLYYCTFTISYTPSFPYQFKMTLIAFSRIPKNSDRLTEATRGRLDSTLVSGLALRQELPRPAKKYRILFVFHV